MKRLSGQISTLVRRHPLAADIDGVGARSDAQPAVIFVMHCSLTGNVLYILMPTGPSSGTLLAWYFAMGVVLWGLVYALARGLSQRGGRPAATSRGGPRSPDVIVSSHTEPLPRSPVSAT